MTIAQWHSIFNIVFITFAITLLLLAILSEIAEISYKKAHKNVKKVHKKANKNVNIVFDIDTKNKTLQEIQLERMQMIKILGGILGGI